VDFGGGGVGGGDVGHSPAQAQQRRISTSEFPEIVARFDGCQLIDTGGSSRGSGGPQSVQSVVLQNPSSWEQQQQHSAGGQQVIPDEQQQQQPESFESSSTTTFQQRFGFFTYMYISSLCLKGKQTNISSCFSHPVVLPSTYLYTPRSSEPDVLHLIPEEEQEGSEVPPFSTYKSMLQQQQQQL
jgi:hypothetical protein